MGKIFEFAANHPWLASGTIAMALVVIFYELRQKAGGLTALSSAKAVQLINRGAQVVDVRDQEHFDAGHIVDAINIPAAELADQADKKLKKSKSIIVICDSGNRSIQAVAVLRRSGYDQSFSLQGGLAAWRNKNLPVVTSN
ncbi:MAG: rhodanese-like domain-containing protein [Gammaproteobacteria bacterium]|jgi:rhodanese-related sulfurtransferase|nr:sulfurtransferase [Chromatiales bacterium]MDP6674872.1 rhodanese-like domain-containing protein [Gammaproteobacteria bacterium]